MTENQNAHRGRVGAQEVEAVKLASDTLIVPSHRDFFNPLLEQAAARMHTDPARYGQHFLIWLALFCAQNGIGRGQR